MRDFRILRQRDMTRRFRQVIERSDARRLAIHIDIKELDVLWDLDPEMAARTT